MLMAHRVSLAPGSCLSGSPGSSSLLVLKMGFLPYRMKSKIDFRTHIAQKICNVLHNMKLMRN